MSIGSLLRRTAMVGIATGATMAVGVASASAHHCFIPMYSLNGPSSPNWFVVSAQEGAEQEGGYTADCAGAVAAGYDALEAAGLPVGIKIFEKMTIGDPKEEGRMNPNGANGKGLEYFAAGSELPGQMVDTWIGGAESYDC